MRTRQETHEINRFTPETTSARRVPRALSHPTLFLFVILTAQLMVVLDATIVNVALPQIQRSLGLSTDGLAWVLNAYILTFGGFLLLGARAGDLFGRRRVFLLGLAIFTVSSMAGGLATSSWQLLAARAIQGIGGALAAPSALSLLTTNFAQGAERNRALGLYTAVSAAGGATGLIAGGLLTELVSWRWVMFVNVPIGLAVMAAGWMILPETDRRHGRFEPLGAITGTAGISGIVLGLFEAGSHGWSSPLCVSGLVVGTALVAVFLRHESRVAQPILPLRLVTDRSRNAANGARAFLYAGFFGLFYFLGQFLQDVQGYSPLRAGLAFIPMPVSVFLASQLSTRYVMPRMSGKRVMLIGTFVATVGLALTTQIDAHTSYAQIVLSLVLIGAGSGASFVALTSASLANVEPEIAGAASGLVNVSQQIGAAVGLAVLVTAFNGLNRGAGLEPTTSAAQAHTLNSLHAVFAIAAGLSLAAFSTILFGLPSARRAEATAELGVTAALADAA
jgi:EmrB/QacA subfamily drug resistance transporter